MATFVAIRNQKQTGLACPPNELCLYGDVTDLFRQPPHTVGGFQFL